MDRKSNGQIGYIHLYDMGGLGLQQFARDYPPQWTKRGLIMDDRWNHGGFVAPMILAHLDRKILAVGGTRHGGPVDTTPSRAFHGHMVTLINRQGGSDCETFALGFKDFKLGPVVGTRTWGGWVGIRGDKPLRDGGMITEPEFGGWDPKGKAWIIEGHGVDPDVVLDLGPDGFLGGKDVQLDYAIDSLLKEIAQGPAGPGAGPADPAAAAAAGAVGRARGSAASDLQVDPLPVHPVGDGPPEDHVREGEREGGGHGREPARERQLVHALLQGQHLASSRGPRDRAPGARQQLRAHVDRDRVLAVGDERPGRARAGRARPPATTSGRRASPRAPPSAARTTGSRASCSPGTAATPAPPRPTAGPEEQEDEAAGQETHGLRLAARGLGPQPRAGQQAQQRRRDRGERREDALGVPRLRPPVEVAARGRSGPPAPTGSSPARGSGRSPPGRPRASSRPSSRRASTAARTACPRGDSQRFAAHAAR